MAESEGLSCAEFVELVTDYLERSLDTRSRLRFEEHLAECEGCETYLEQMRETLSMLGRIPRQTLSEEAQVRLLTAFRDRKATAS
ncbi:zf-HC2 domain-containing protein [Streptomyces sp. NPDC046197]|uniref:zf-HC2 domain-containing protein n=1 Tax=Streptomyces sp. NPDC046197 TaxID=3154337 RepID=UPI0033FA519A